MNVLILFFNRPQSLQPVFDTVRQARPHHLFLYQDGPRGDRDLPGIEACREVVSHVDWPCEVHRLYQEKNYGCDPSEFLAQRWALSIVDRCIFLEDDDIPSQSFFRFCDEMLERYKDDARVSMVAGFNTEDEWASPYDYLFTSTLSIWGWATWRRVVEQWDEHYTWLDNAETVARMEDVMRRRGDRMEMLRMARDHRASGKAFYETILWAHMMQTNTLAVMPTKNLVRNLGPAGDSVHFSATLETLPTRLRRLHTMQPHDLQWPLRHPPVMVDDIAFHDAVYRTHAWNNPGIKVRRSLEELWLNLRRGNFGEITKAVRRRISKWTGNYHHA